MSGGTEGAKKGTLSIMLGGEASDLERVRPILATMGQTITHIGPVDSGQLTKAINQIIIAGTYWGVAEGNMIRNEYPLGFRVRLHRKDMEIALHAAKDLGVSLPIAAMVGQIENALISRGFGDEDVSAIARAVREQSGL